MVTAGVRTRVDRLGLRPLWDGAIEFLRDDVRDDGLFSFSARRHGDGLIHDYDHPWALRYSINSWLGLQAAARADARLADVPDQVGAFVDRWSDRTTNAADLGLLTVLLSERGDDARAADAVARAVGALPRRPDVQTLGWVLWGACAAGERNTASVLLRRLLDELVDERTGLPHHTAQRYRGGILSFGGLVYFLRALHEAHTALGDERAGSLFVRGVERALALQGADGGWPWMIDAATGRVFDRYPLFTVHQDAMAMLFLHPARAEEAIARSVRWALGGNELGLRMYAEEPTFVGYRALQRAETMPRARRYARWLTRAEDAQAERVVVNRECRSYHLGWLLYAWAGDV